MRKNKENDFAQKFRLLNSQECSDEIKWSMSSSDEEDNNGNITCNLTNKHRYIKRKRRRKPNNVNNLDITVVDTTGFNTGEKSPILCEKSRIEVSPVLVPKFPQRSPILVPRSFQKSSILHRNSVKVTRKLFKSNNDDIAGKVSINDGICNIKEENITSNDLIVDSESNTSNKLCNKTSKDDIYKSVKCFFDSIFTSDNASQNSISDASTPKDNTSDEVDISSGTNDEPSNHKVINKSDSYEKVYKDVKKTKYKKDGVAYRLNVLLRKQNACHSLWKHEKFLADNSNFIIPKEKHLIFRVLNAEFEYGTTILSAIDENTAKYFIFINNVYLSQKIECDSIVKIYNPYTVIECDDYKLLLNVSKYDYLPMILGE